MSAGIGDFTQESKTVCSGTEGRTDAEAETPVLWPPHAKS